MTCQNAPGSTGLITVQIWPTLKFPPNYPERSNFSLVKQRPPFFSTLFLSPLQTLIALEAVWLVCSSDHFPLLAAIAAICWIFIQAKHKSRESVYVLTWPADKHTFFIFAKVIQPRGKVLHNRAKKMYDAGTSARQLTLNFSCISFSL